MNFEVNLRKYAAPKNENPPRHILHHTYYTTPTTPHHHTYYTILHQDTKDLQKRLHVYWKHTFEKLSFGNITRI